MWVAGMCAHTLHMSFTATISSADALHLSPCPCSLPEWRAPVTASRCRSQGLTFPQPHAGPCCVTPITLRRWSLVSRRRCMRCIYESRFSADPSI